MLHRKFSTNWKLYGVLTVFIIGLITIWQDRVSVPSIVHEQIHPSRQLHPVERLVADHRVQFENIQARQSTSLPEAVAEYKRRYGRDPPDGFDYWFKLAQRHDFVMIDEFDTFMQSIEPYHGVAPYVLRQRMHLAYEEAGDRMATLLLTDGELQIDSNLFVGEGGLPPPSWLRNIPYNMTLLLNSWDEAMVAAPWNKLEEALANAGKQQKLHDEDDPERVMFGPSVDTGIQRGWLATKHACPPNSPSVQSICPGVSKDDPLPFIKNVTESKNVCQNCRIIELHGTLIHPENLIAAHELVPIWSASKPAHFHDILYPSHYYGAVRQDYRPDLDPLWAEKDNKFYWVGSTTGGHATERNWNQLHRQRFVLGIAKDNANDVQVLKETGTGTWIPTTVPVKEVSETFFDVRMSKVVQCEPEVCKVEELAFEMTEETEKDQQDEAYKHRFVVDIDGNAFSGRFYRLLESRSVVIKQTIFKEWHDDRVFPWVHYIPLSTGFEELPELAQFLAGTGRGLELSHRMALESTQWHNAALRDVDTKIVMYRMMLEYGRLMNSDI